MSTQAYNVLEAHDTTGRACFRLLFQRIKYSARGAVKTWREAVTEFWVALDGPVGKVKTPPGARLILVRMISKKPVPRLDRR